jgi:alkylhydroperoxidase family enzyme
MLLRASGEMAGAGVDMAAVNGEIRGDGGVAAAAELVAFTEAVMAEDEAAVAKARTALRAVLTPEAFVDTCGVIAAFNVVDRIADSTGIPLDEPMVAMTAEIRNDLDLARFRSSANTPGEP